MKNLVFILLFLFSCSKIEVENKIEITGTFINENLELTFENGNIYGFSKCNSISGNYNIYDNNIIISAKSTKIYCENDFNLIYLQKIEGFEVNNNILKLYGSDYEIILLRE